MVQSVSPFVSLDDAKTQLSSLVERAARGEEVVISKDGLPMAKLVPIPFCGQPRKPANAMGISHIAEDFDAADEEIIQKFEDSDWPFET